MGVRVPVDLKDSSTAALVEVALSVGFEEFHRLMRYELDDLHSRYSDRFPNDEEKAPHKPFIEEPDGGLVALPSASPITNIRRWFGSEDGSRLIQVQRNWFARNWRVTVQDSGNGAIPLYPGYPALRADFAESLGNFIDFVEDTNLGGFKPLQCEISYRLQLQGGGLWDHPDELHRVAQMFSGRSGNYLPGLEAMRTITQYVIPDDDGRRVGRLYGRLETARSKDGTDFLILTVFARGAPIGDGVDGVFAFLDTGQQWIVNGIRDFLTLEASEWYGLD
ncbi:MAG: hypothetical protein OXF41_11945 [bacterium]|nr:hypothetical protein [bacterium]